MLYKFIFLLFSFVSINAITIRVLLDEQSGSSKKEWQIQASEGFVCTDVQSPESEAFFAADTLTMCVQRGQIVCNGKRCLTDQLRIESQEDTLRFDGNMYRGSLLLIKKEDTIYFINELDIEDYVCSVLRWESFPGWSIEVNKAFAIASRSYVLARVSQAHKKKIPFHVRGTNVHQTFKGFHEVDHLREAVEQTRGMILTYKNKPIDAMFDVCCGGIIPAHIHGINFASAPYLARSYACTFCKSCKSYSYCHALSPDHLQKLITKQAPKIKKINDIQIKRDKAGLVQEVKIHGTGGSSILTGKQLYSLVDKIKSFSFSIYKKGQQFIINGKGFGHHLGICQWGARAMVDQGRNYLQVLKFYYPGAVMKQLLYKERRT